MGDKGDNYVTIKKTDELYTKNMELNGALS